MVVSAAGLRRRPFWSMTQLYFTTPFNRVIAVNPETGQQLWHTIRTSISPGATAMD